MFTRCTGAIQEPIDIVGLAAGVTFLRLPAPQDCGSVPFHDGLDERVMMR